MAWWATQCYCAEPAREFLEKLRANGYYDQALEYLDQIAASPLISAEWKESLNYEKGLVLIAAARTQRDLGVREQQINDAQRLLQEFIAQHSEHAQANSAREKLAHLFVERALVKTDLAKRGDKDANLVEARTHYEEAVRVLAKLQEDVSKQLDAMPKFINETDDEQRALAAKRDRLRTEHLNVLLETAGIREKIADTFEPGSGEAKRMLTEAAAMFAAIHDRYGTRVPGLYARMYHARCLLKQKKMREALDIFLEVLDKLHDEGNMPEELRTLKTETLKYAMHCWLDPSIKRQGDAIKRGGDWIAKSRSGDDRNPDWLGLRLNLAKAYILQADEARKAKPTDRLINQSLGQARAQAAFVARFNSEYQKEAQALLAELGGTSRSDDSVQAKTFTDAQTSGKDAIDAMQTASVLLQEMPNRIQKEEDAKLKTELQKQLDDAQTSYESSQQQAMLFFRQALRLADPQTDRNELNMVRYFVCYLNYIRGDFHEAALIGDFVARRYPDHAAARQCAKIAMASYLKVYAESQATQKQFETDRVVSVAEFIATSWPGQPEAEEAISTLLPFMINAGELERAQAFLSKIPDTSPRRADGELKTGQAIWANYLTGAQDVARWESEGASDGADIEARRRELENTKQQALAILAKGYGRMRDKKDPDKSNLLALLSLAQVYVESGQPRQAIEVLEHEQLGPLTLVGSGHPDTKDPGVVEQTYKTALRAYIGALAETSDRTEVLQKAQTTMAKMKTAIGDAEGGQDRLVAVYISLARSLENQLKIASPESRTALSEAFESFLKQIRDESTEFSVLNWIAETFMSMGAGLDSGRSTSPEVTRFYSESKATFERILAQSKPSPQMSTQIQVRMALLARKQKDFKAAIDTYVKVLTENQMRINVQVEAAKALQEWATATGTGTYFDQAIVGLHPGRDGRNVVWGWGRIAQITARNAQFRDTFHEANVNMAICREMRSATVQGESKTKLLNSAFNGVAMVRHLYPDLGGDKWEPQYESVVKRIQKAQGKPTVGLQAIPPPAPTSQPPATK